ncbi:MULTISPECIES: restriction endonuclease [Streptomyces]|uniref:restriction endonuclease n=1 Tax=Streptomyces TaxID=1883 RepID=UPI0013C4C6CD|nr:MULTISPECIES: restriction endonuclease [Streptomyces]MDX3579361.1 restriction endonuclease [Streptomyces sp. FL07-04A]
MEVGEADLQRGRVQLGAPLAKQPESSATYTYWSIQLGRTPEWQEYQQEVSSFLSELGFNTRIDETIEGARGRHDIDVVARLSIAGVDILWLVECKAWQRRIPKERILTLQGIVDDIGADRGLVFSESGFQAGAIRATQNTNITLTSLEDFRLNFQDEVSATKAKVLDERIARLMKAYEAVWDLADPERQAAFSRYSGPPGFDFLEGGPHAMTGVTSHLSMMRQSLENARFDRWPVAYFPLDLIDGESFDVTDWEGLLFVAEQSIVTCDRIYGHMMTSGVSPVAWKTLQPPELTSLLSALRGQ